MFLNNIVPVEDVEVRKEVLKTRFSCDLQKCKGACCTFESHYGAPLMEEEIDIIGQILPIVKKYLPEEHIRIIENDGFYKFIDKELMTNSLNNKACVFVYYENGIAKCGIEKAYIEGKTDFKKPISCHLFPIRISKFGKEILRYEKFSECSPALKKGEEENITVAEFCGEALERKYGKKWYSVLKDKTK
jgi:Protein of unknown function (DUF3109)